MLDSHSSLGIAQIIFYVPIVPLAIFLMIRNGKIRPRMAWYPFIPFSLMRLAGGILTLVFEQKKDNIGVYIATLIMLNVGVVPLIIANLGLTRIILMDNYSHNPTSTKIAKLLRIAFIAAVILFAAGGGVSSFNLSLSRILTLVGYVVFAVVLVVLISMQVYFFGKRLSLTESSRKILRANLIASPFLILRTVYGILEVAEQDVLNTIWSPLFGSAVAFALMALLPEYIAICVWFYTGYTIPPRRELSEEVASNGTKTTV